MLNINILWVFTAIMNKCLILVYDKRN